MDEISYLLSKIYYCLIHNADSKLEYKDKLDVLLRGDLSSKLIDINELIKDRFVLKKDVKKDVKKKLEVKFNNKKFQDSHVFSYHFLYKYPKEFKNTKVYIYKDSDKAQGEIINVSISKLTLDEYLKHVNSNPYNIPIYLNVVVGFYKKLEKKTEILLKGKNPDLLTNPFLEKNKFQILVKTEATYVRIIKEYHQNWFIDPM